MNKESEYLKTIRKSWYSDGYQYIDPEEITEKLSPSMRIKGRFIWNDKTPQNGGIITKIDSERNSVFFLTDFVKRTNTEIFIHEMSEFYYAKVETKKPTDYENPTIVSYLKQIQEEHNFKNFSNMHTWVKEYAKLKITMKHCKTFFEQNIQKINIGTTAENKKKELKERRAKKLG